MITTSSAEPIIYKFTKDKKKGWGAVFLSCKLVLLYSTYDYLNEAWGKDWRECTLEEVKTLFPHIKL
jgi:ABC-type molybdate transport system substrate-binding protein